MTTLHERVDTNQEIIAPRPLTPRLRKYSVGVAKSIHENECILIIPIVSLLLFPSPFLFVGFLAALGVHLCRWIATGSPLRRTRASFPILVLLTMTFVGFAISPAQDLAVLTAGQLMASTTIFFVILDKGVALDRVWIGAGILVLLGISFALVAPFTVEWSPGKVFQLPAFYDQSWPRIPKITQRNILAGAIAPTVPVVLSLMLGNNRRLRVLAALGLAPILVILWLLQSRGALFALAFGLVIIVVFYQKWLLPLVSIALIILLGIGNALNVQPLVQYLYGQMDSPAMRTFVERQDLWVQALYLIRQSPLAGIGLGAYPRVAPFVWPYTLADPGYTVPHAHNLFLQIALDTGIFGLSAFLALVLMAVKILWRTYQRGIERNLTIGLLGAIAVLIAHGFGDSVVWGTAKSSIVLWIILGLAFCIDNFTFYSKQEYTETLSD